MITEKLSRLRFFSILLEPSTNTMDAAIGKTTRECVAQWTPKALTPSAETIEAAPEMKVIKHGYGTGESEGVIRCVDAAVCVKDDGVLYHYVEQIVIENLSKKKYFCYGGDSGALVMANTAAAGEEGKPRVRRPLGLLFALNDRGEIGRDVIKNFCLANPIDAVLGHFKVRIDDWEEEPGDQDCEIAKR